MEGERERSSRHETPALTFKLRACSAQTRRYQSHCSVRKSAQERRAEAGPGLPSFSAHLFPHTENMQMSDAETSFAIALFGCLLTSTDIKKNSFMSAKIIRLTTSTGELASPRSKCQRRSLDFRRRPESPPSPSDKSVSTTRRHKSQVQML
jgi:hypothetical protein